MAVNVPGVCSHMRACEIWTASLLNPYLFKTYKYNSWDEFVIRKGYGAKAYPMGIVANSSMPHGKYYLYLTFDEIAPYIQTRTEIVHSFV